MRSKKYGISILLQLLCIGAVQAQYSAKLETGYWVYNYRMIRVDPGPNWKGYYLHGKPDGADVNLVNGLAFAEKRMFAGVGIGYLNFAGISGVSFYADVEYLPLRKKLTPLLNLKIGRSHIWNQYDGGTATALTELTGGLNYKPGNKLGLFLKSGIAFTQQSMFIPVRLGLRL